MMRLNHMYTYDSNDVGVILLMAVPLALWLLGTVKKPGKILIALLLVAIGAAIARSGSRGTFVGAMALGASLLWLVHHISLGRRLLIVGTISLGLFLSAPPGYWNQMTTLVNPTEDYNWTSKDGRKQVALRGLGYMMDYPIFGIGIDMFPRAEGMISEKAQNHVPGTGIRWTAAHNSYVQAGAELGIPGLLLWCSLIVGGIVGMVRLRRRLPRSWAQGDPEQRFLYVSTAYLPAAYVGFAVPAFFVSFAWMDPIYLLSALFCGVHSAVRRRIMIDQSGAASRSLSMHDRHIQAAHRPRRGRTTRYA
jgi:O-antigen ligase